MHDFDDLFASLAKSPFRRKFRLQGKDLAYLQEKGISLVLKHAVDFVEARLAPAYIANDGKQTPMRGHPVFVAQHATATCCRGCLEKWHEIPKGRSLSESEQVYVLEVLSRWLEQATLSAESAHKSKADVHLWQLDIFQ